MSSRPKGTSLSAEIPVTATAGAAADVEGALGAVVVVVRAGAVVTVGAGVTGIERTGGMVVTGISADKLVPFGLLLIGLGAALTNAARRFGRARYNFL